MSLNRRSNGYRQQQGSMLVIALFILVVISLLVASLSRILSSTADSVANEVYSAKAYFASDSGMEYGIYKVLDNATFCTDPVIIPSNFLTGEVGLENCSVKLECESIDLPNTGHQYYLKSTATCDGGKIVAQHTVEAEVKL